MSNLTKPTKQTCARNTHTHTQTRNHTRTHAHARTHKCTEEKKNPNNDFEKITETTPIWQRTRTKNDCNNCKNNNDNTRTQTSQRPNDEPTTTPHKKQKNKMQHLAANTMQRTKTTKAKPPKKQKKTTIISDEETHTQCRKICLCNADCRFDHIDNSCNNQIFFGWRWQMAAAIAESTLLASQGHSPLFS